jgi:putative transcriptional regulator
LAIRQLRRYTTGAQIDNLPHKRASISPKAVKHPKVLAQPQADPRLAPIRHWRILATARPEIGLREEDTEMKQASRPKRPEDSSFGDKLLKSAQQARDWVQGKPVRVRVTYVPAPRVDVRKLRARMGLSQAQFAAKFGFSLDSLQNWEQGHRQPEGPARTLLVVIAKNPKAVEEALGSS